MAAFLRVGERRLATKFAIEMIVSFFTDERHNSRLADRATEALFHVSGVLSVEFEDRKLVVVADKRCSLEDIVVALVSVGLIHA